MLIKKREVVSFRHCDYSKPFIEYSSDIDDLYKNIDECNPKKKKNKIFILADYMIADMVSNTQLYHTILFSCTMKY